MSDVVCLQQNINSRHIQQNIFLTEVSLAIIHRISVDYCFRDIYCILIAQYPNGNGSLQGKVSACAFCLKTNSETWIDMFRMKPHKNKFFLKLMVSHHDIFVR